MEISAIDKKITYFTIWRWRLMGKSLTMTMVLFFIIVPISVFADEPERVKNIEVINTEDFENIELINEEMPAEEGVFQSDDFPIIEEMVASWEENGYPDFVGHVYYDQETDKFKLGLVEMDDPEAEELIASLEEIDNIEIETATFAYNDLLKIQTSISEELEKSSNNEEGINGVGVGWTTIDGEVSGFGSSGKEFRVIVTVDESVYDEYKEKFASAYGEKVYVESGEFGTFADDIAREDIQPISIQNNQLWIYLSLFVLFCAVIIFVFITYQKFTIAKQTISGHVVSSSQPLSKKEVISAVKENKVKPSDDIYERIVSKIKNTK